MQTTGHVFQLQPSTSQSRRTSGGDCESWNAGMWKNKKYKKAKVAVIGSINAYSFGHY